MSLGLTVGLTLLAATMPTTAHAAPSSVSIAGAGGWTYTTKQPWAGLDIAFHHDGLSGFAFVGRVKGAYAIGDDRPFGDVELGFMGVAPTQEKATVRVGVRAGLEVYTAVFPMRFTVPSTYDPQAWGAVGFLPYGVIAAELGWTAPENAKAVATYALGLDAGLGLSVARQSCTDDPTQICTEPGMAFYGGLTGRMALKNGFFMQALVGPTPTLSLGWVWQPKPKVELSADE